MDEIARLDQATLPAQDALSSLESTSTAVFSIKDESTATKPTSTGTPYPNYVYRDKDKGRRKPPYASSLSVAYGSGSEAELEQHMARRDALLAMGDWATGDLIPNEPLKGAARAKTRNRHKWQPKQKKPVIGIIRPSGKDKALPNGDDEAVVTIKSPAERPGQSSGLVMETISSSHPPTEPTNLRRRVTQHDEDQIRLAEEGQFRSVAVQDSGCRPLSPTRVYVIAGLIVMILLASALSAFGAHQTGRTRMACTKGIVFATTVLVAFLTVLAMVIARRAPQEALLAGLTEIVIGFMLLAELNDFM